VRTRPTSRISAIPRRTFFALHRAICSSRAALTLNDPLQDRYSLRAVANETAFNITMRLSMRYPAFTWLSITAFIIVLVVLCAPGNRNAYAGNEATEDQVAGILYREAAQGKIKIVILDFSVSSADIEKKLSEKELKDRGSRYADEFTAELMNKIKDAGKRDIISIIDRGRLDDIAREKNIPLSAVPERSATEIGRIAGVDVIISGRLLVAGDAASVTVKVVRVRDGEILDIVKQDKQGKTVPVVHSSVTLMDGVEELKINSYKALPLNLVSAGTLSAAIEVVHGNPIDIVVIPGTELENFKGRKEFKQVADFTAENIKSYKRSASLDKGDYYLVIQDSSLGVFSKQSSRIKVTVQLERYNSN
jgi:curli biogenesis system outer membrane secretion channel CsgG